MSDEKFPMTKNGYDRLRDELDRLKRVERPKNIQAIEEARANGDLSENADYDAAKEHQGKIAMRIAELEHRLALSEVIDVSRFQGLGHVTFGATVTLVDTKTDKEVTYRIVGADEANVKENTISIQSPLAQALIGKEEGDEVEVRAPSGIKEYGIVRIEYLT